MAKTNGTLKPLSPQVPSSQVPAAYSSSALSSSALSGVWQGKATSRACSLFAALVALLVLVGWAFHVPPLVTILPTLPAMAQSTAATFLLLSLSLWMQSEEHALRKMRQVGQAAALAALLIGAGVLVRYVLLSLAHQSMTSRDGEHLLNRMSPNSAVNFVLLSTALLLLDTQDRASRWPAQALAFIVILDALVALVGQLYGVTFLYGFSAFLGMAVHTVVLFLVLSTGVLLARPERGFVAILLANDAAGKVARRFLPLALIAPVVLGGVGLFSQRLSPHQTPLLAYLLVTISIGLLGWLIWGNVLALSAQVRRSQSYEHQVAELERAHLETALRASEQRLLLAVQSAGIGTWCWNFPFDHLDWSDRCYALFGLPPEVPMTPSRLYECIHPEDRARTQAAIEAAISGGGFYDIEYRVVRPDRSVHWIAATGRGYQDEAGTPIRFEGTMQDIDEKKRAGERQRQFLRDVLASVTEGHLVLCDTAADLPAIQEFHRQGFHSSSISISMTGGLKELRSAVQDACEELGFADDRCFDLVTAASEAGMNAAVHVGSGEGFVTINAQRGTIQVRIADSGSGIALENLPHATLMKGYSSAGTLGHGMKMILQTTDRVFLLTGTSGTTIVMEQERVASPSAW